MSCQQIATSLSLHWFMANFEQSHSRILDAWSVKRPFSLLITFCLTKTENITNKCNKALIKLLWVKVLFCKKNLLQKNAEIKKIKEVLVLKNIFPKTTYVYVLRPKYEVTPIILTRLRQGVILLSPHPKKAL